MMADALLSSGLLASDPMPVTTLVPAPSSPRSMRERGRWHMRNVTNSLARSLRRRGMDVDTAALLRTTKTSGKSVQMRGAAQRSRRLQGHIGHRCAPTLPTQRRSWWTTSSPRAPQPGNARGAQRRRNTCDNGHLPGAHPAHRRKHRRLAKSLPLAGGDLASRRVATTRSSRTPAIRADHQRNPVISVAADAVDENCP